MIERIAVVAPMLDEAAHVEDLVGDLAEQDFVGDLAIFVADGGSTDRSPELLADAAGRRGLNLTLLENPRRSPAAGLNVCVRAALRQKPRADLVVRVDCHSRLPRDYLRQCARISEETGAWSVGGFVIPTGESRGRRAAACA